MQVTEIIYECKFWSVTKRDEKTKWNYEHIKGEYYGEYDRIVENEKYRKGNKSTDVSTILKNIYQ